MIPAKPPHPIVAQTPIIGSAAEAWHEAFRHARALLIIAVVPFLLYETFWYACLFTLGGFADGAVWSILTLLPDCLLTVACCRLFLLGEAPQLWPRWHRRHSRVLGILLILLVFWFPLEFSSHYAEDVTGVAPSQMQYLGLVFISLCLRYVYLRLALMLPAASVGERFGLRRAWLYSRGQGLRLLLASLLAYMPVIVASIAAEQIYEARAGADYAWPDGPASPAFGWPLILMSVFEDIATLLALALDLAILTSAFRRVTGWVPAADPQTLKAFE